MSEGAPLRAATVASMAAEQHAHEVEQLRARLAEQQPHVVEQLEQRLAAVIAPAAKRLAAASDVELGRDESFEQQGSSVASGAASRTTSKMAPDARDASEDAPLPARTASVAQQQQEWALRVGDALLGQLSSPADQVPEQELHWQ